LVHLSILVPKLALNRQYKFILEKYAAGCKVFAVARAFPREPVPERLAIHLRWTLKSFMVCSIFLSIALTAAHSFSALPSPVLTQKPAPPDTVMLFALQKEDPVHIMQATFGANNALIDALLENRSHQKIQSYRLGWAVVKKDDIRIVKGNQIDLPKDVDSTTSFSIPGPENMAKDELAKHPTGIVFYVAELQFEDGMRWLAEPRKIRKEAAEMVK
jgi:hypothetical protein